MGQHEEEAADELDLPPGPSMVYKLYDVIKWPLYVGITSRASIRLIEHAQTKSWFW